MENIKQLPITDQMFVADIIETTTGEMRWKHIRQYFVDKGSINIIDSGLAWNIYTDSL